MKEELNALSHATYVSYFNPKVQGFDKILGHPY